MGRYRYIALDEAGKVESGELPASSSEAARADLAARNIIPVSLKAVGGFGLGEFLNRDIALGRGLKRGELAFFIRTLASLLNAGMALDAALGVTAGLQSRERGREVIANLLSAVKAGASLSRALDKEPELFSAEMRAMVSAGEAGGRLAAVLEELADQQERTNRLRSKVQSAMYYPAFLLVMALAAVFIVVGVVLPEFEPVFRSAGQDLPAMTQAVRSFGLFVADYYVWIILLGALAIFGPVYARRGPVGRLAVDGFVLGLPKIGGLVRQVGAARLARTLGSQLKGGVPLVQALETSARALGNAVLERAAQDAVLGLQGGQPLSRALASGDAFPDVIIQMCTVGEQTGRLDAMLLKAAEFYDEQVTTSLDRMVAMLVPVVTLIMGLVVAVIVFSVLSAILGLNNLL